MAKESRKYIIFATLSYRSSSLLGYYCPCKETRSETRIGPLRLLYARAYYYWYHY
jgi:hypothetical protein